jgi:hypothetical protein
MKLDIIISKIGGKIFENENNLHSTISQFKSLLQLKRTLSKVILIPGGGSYANFIRELDFKMNLGNDISHWAAIYAMNKNGLEICKKFPEILYINDYTNLKDIIKETNHKLLCIFLPFDFLYQTDELPHSWDVTSDSITLYIASKLHLKECYLIKDVDGIISGEKKLIRELTTNEYHNLINQNDIDLTKSKQEKLKRSQPIDSYIIQLINKHGIDCIILNGSSNSKKIIAYFYYPEFHQKKQLFF